MTRRIPTNTTQHEIISLFKSARSPVLRSMREFAEEELVIPDGPFAGRRFRCDRQPYTRLWLEAAGSGRWSRCVATGPTQSGKTLSCFVIPLLYHLFEVGETVICGLPDMDMAADKWREDILPSIENSQFRDLLPKQGGGSRGGKVESIQFTNGATLNFMSGGGGDKSRAGFTSRVVVITETDGMDQPGAASRESDKITQLEARTRAYGSRKRIYMECTVSTEEGRTWQEYMDGTQSRIVLPCPHCQTWVLPERDHLVGWKEAKTQAVARNDSSFCCPSCGANWTHAERADANMKSILLHEGQSVDEAGTVQGDERATDTLGFRWSAVHNLFLTAADLAADEWKASCAADEDNAEKEMRQFVWCIPVTPAKWDETALSVNELMNRVGHWPRGVVPPETFKLTAAIDLGKYLAHWILVAWTKEANGHVVDYARIEILSDDMGVEKAIMIGLRQFRDQARIGWPIADTEGDVHKPDQVWIDAGYMTEVVYEFCRESGDKFRPAVGRGAAQQRQQWYNRPTRTGSVVRHIGQGFHITRLLSPRTHLVEIDADCWKTWVHARLATPINRTPQKCPAVHALVIYEAARERGHRSIDVGVCDQSLSRTGNFD